MFIVAKGIEKELEANRLILHFYHSSTLIDIWYCFL